MAGRRRAGMAQAELDQTWMKRARCAVCTRPFVVNNYEDRKVRKKRNQVFGKWLCPHCRSRQGTFTVQLMVSAERMAKELNLYIHDEPADPATCKCMAHVAQRILAQHEGKRAR